MANTWKGNETTDATLIFPQRPQKCRLRPRRCTPQTDNSHGLQLRRLPPSVNLMGPPKGHSGTPHSPSRPKNRQIRRNPVPRSRTIGPWTTTPFLLLRRSIPPVEDSPPSLSRWERLGEGAFQ